MFTRSNQVPQIPVMTNYPIGARSLPLQILENGRKDQTIPEEKQWSGFSRSQCILSCGIYYVDSNQGIQISTISGAGFSQSSYVAEWVNILVAYVIDSCWLELEMRLLNWQCVTQTRNGICLMWFYMKSEEFIGQMFCLFKHHCI